MIDKIQKIISNDDIPDFSDIESKFFVPYTYIESAYSEYPFSHAIRSVDFDFAAAGMSCGEDMINHTARVIKKTIFNLLPPGSNKDQILLLGDRRAASFLHYMNKIPLVGERIAENLVSYESKFHDIRFLLKTDMEQHVDYAHNSKTHETTMLIVLHEGTQIIKFEEMRFFNVWF